GGVPGVWMLQGRSPARCPGRVVVGSLRGERCRVSGGRPAPDGQLVRVAGGGSGPALSPVAALRGGESRRHRDGGGGPRGGYGADPLPPGADPVRAPTGTVRPGRDPVRVAAPRAEGDGHGAALGRPRRLPRRAGQRPR